MSLTGQKLFRYSSELVIIEAYAFSLFNFIFLYVVVRYDIEGGKLAHSTSILELSLKLISRTHLINVTTLLTPRSWPTTLSMIAMWVNYICM